MVEEDGDQEKPDSNTVTVEKQKTEEIPYLNVFQWSQIRTGEQAWVYDTWSELTTDQERELVFILKNTEGNLVAVLGPIGSGKTTLFYHLKENLRDKKPNLKLCFKRVIKGREQFGFWDKEWIEDPETRKKSSVKAWWWEFEDATDLLIDLSDYTKSSAKFVNKVLDAIQDWWWHRRQERENEIRRKRQASSPLPNIVFFLQEEGPKDHFFLGKCQKIYLKPFSIQDLLSIYKKQFRSFSPFTEDGLTEIARLSQGNPRHYREYINECLKRHLIGKLYESKPSISIEDVKEWISKDMILESMKYQLIELFPRSKEKQIKAVTVLQWLREHGSTSQNTITQKLFDGHKMAASRILNKLETLNYIKSEEHGKEKTWTPIQNLD